MLRLAVLTLAGMTVISSPALAQDEQGDGASAREEMVCKRLKDSTSRARSRKVCMTQAQWDQQSRDAQEALNNDRRTFNIDHGKD